MKKRFVRNRKAILLVLTVVLSISVLSMIASAQPVPKNVIGRVFTNSSNGVQNGIPVLINDTTAGTYVFTAVNAPPVPFLRGSYSATIQGNTGDTITVTAWNATHFGNATTTLVATTTSIDVYLNMTRGSEANVTILSPSDNTVYNKSIDFNVTANVSIIGADGVECNATLSFTDTAVINVSHGFNHTRVLGNIGLGDHVVVNWTVRGFNPGETDLSVQAYCASDLEIVEDSNSDSVLNLSVTNTAPTILTISMQDPLTITSGDNTTVTCNATILDVNTFEDIDLVNMTLFHESSSNIADDDNNFHYTNTSCINVSSSGNQATFSCGVEVAYYADSGVWTCNVSVIDKSNATVFNTTNTTLPELLAINIDTSSINYGTLSVLETSADDVNVTVSNIGNIPFNISVDGYARFDGDNLSMNCTQGNISLSNQRYSISAGTPYSDMFNLTDDPVLVPNITFFQRTDDLGLGNDTNSTHWKLQIPPLVRGTCNGSVVFRTQLLD